MGQAACAPESPAWREAGLWGVRIWDRQKVLEGCPDAVIKRLLRVFLVIASTAQLQKSHKKNLVVNPGLQFSSISRAHACNYPGPLRLTAALGGRFHPPLSRPHPSFQISASSNEQI